MRSRYLLCLALLESTTTAGCRLLDQGSPTRGSPPAAAPPVAAQPVAAQAPTTQPAAGADIATAESEALARRAALFRADARDEEIAKSVTATKVAGAVIERYEHEKPRAVILGDGRVQLVERTGGGFGRVQGEAAERVVARGSLRPPHVKRLLVKLLKAGFFTLPKPEPQFMHIRPSTVTLSLDGRKHEAGSHEVFELFELGLVAAGVSTCRESWLCKRYGRCTPRDGWCVVTSDADCLASWDCKEDGLCAARDGVCQAISAEACGRADPCRLGGQCQASRGVCVAATDADCRRGTWCANQGLCAAKGGKCVASLEGCRASTDCRVLGACTPGPKRCERAK